MIEYIKINFFPFFIPPKNEKAPVMALFLWRGIWVVAGLDSAEVYTTKAINQELNQISEGINQKIQQARDALNNEIKKLQDELNKAINPNPDIRLKAGINFPQALTGYSAKADQLSYDPTGSFLNSFDNINKDIANDKKTTFGRSDFWIVKLFDKKEQKEKTMKLVATPNPVRDVTEISIGYQYNKGTAFLYNLSGHQLMQMKLSRQSFPVDMSSLPEGIYIVNVKTDKSSDSLKLIKTFQ